MHSRGRMGTPGFLCDIRIDRTSTSHKRELFLSLIEVMGGKTSPVQEI